MNNKVKVLFATGNQHKYELMKERLKDYKNIEIVNPKMLKLNLKIVEDGKTPEENAIKKARQYYEKIHMPIIAEDSGLYIDNFSEEDQPGLFVKRIQGIENPTEEDLLNYYIKKLGQYGGESLACYHTGICIIDETGKIYTKTIKENKFLMTSNKNTIPTISGGVLDCISFDLNCKKYFNERTEEDRKTHYQNIDEEYRKIMNEVF